MARTCVRTPSARTSRVGVVVALSAALAWTATGCSDDSSDSGKGSGGKKDGPVVVATTTWEGAFAKAAGAKDVTVLVPPSTHHAPDYDPKPSDLAAVAKADFVLYAPFEPYAGKIKDAAGSKAELVKVNLDNDADKAGREVTRLGGLFGTESAAARWKTSFDREYAKLSADLKSSWPGGKSPAVVSQVFTTWSARMAGARTVGTYGPEPVKASQVAELSGKKPALVLDNAHMSTGTVLPGSGAEQLKIANYPGDDLDLLPVYRDAAAQLKKAMKKKA
ncbi:metal ABC transporter solute-binding protein, Zn/Mn family [Streptomyces sp. NPDC059063]|uniref:metal ABC transporter solute-binding protein, Zn/Mn family n=1 Tax=unclassified Streptomyces TaxID=2593676 RepID=UPI0036BB0074